jgi:cytochrome c-type biogenesis protein CcmH|tara:strand:+ start:318 stop:776 length:459 start_codon:yes stop_codon:yes gene_type:complete
MKNRGHVICYNFSIKSVGLLILFLSTLIAETDLATDIKRSLISPCCWAGTVYDLDHNPEMEELINQFISQGKTKQEILEYYIGLYGERILAVPIAEGFNIMVWVTPILAGMIGITFLFFFLRTPNDIPSSVISAPSEVPFDDEIEKELQKMD